MYCSEAIAEVEGRLESVSAMIASPMPHERRGNLHLFLALEFKQ